MGITGGKLLNFGVFIEVVWFFEFDNLISICFLCLFRYNPILWGVPKGSYASDPNGPCRLIEFRKMVQVANFICVSE